MGVVFCLHCSSGAGNNVLLLSLFLPHELGLCALLVERKKSLEGRQVLFPLSPGAKVPGQGSIALGGKLWGGGGVWSRGCRGVRL